MKAFDPNSGISRRRFLEYSAQTVAGARLLATGTSPAVASVEAMGANSTSAPGKIALEEHFVIAETLAASYGAPSGPEFQHTLEEIGSARIAEMDRGGLDLCVLSLVGDGIQAIPNVSEAIRIARKANDHLAEQIA